MNKMRVNVTIEHNSVGEEPGHTVSCQCPVTGLRTVRKGFQLGYDLEQAINALAREVMASDQANDSQKTR